MLMRKRMKKKKNSLIWQFQKSETDSPNYLIGTMHVSDARAFGLLSDFEEKIRVCEIYAAEMPLDQTDMSDINTHLLLPDNQSLTDVLPKAYFRRLETFLLKRFAISVQNFIPFKPIVVTNFLTEKCFSNDNWTSLDQTLWDFAQNEGKILRGVESQEEQVSIFKKITIEEQIKMLKDTIQHYAKYRRQLHRLAKFYEQADILAIYKAVRKTAHGNRQLLLFNRNFLMTNRIEALTTEGSVCVAIGAGHLAGKKGVLNLLKKQGFLVKSVSLTE